MIRIAICDDENTVCSKLEQILITHCKNMSIPVEIDVHYSAEKLMLTLQHSFYDLIFLDIEMDGLNGIETGRLIRQNVQQASTQIIYISCKSEYALALFQNHPFDFLLKPLKSENVITVMDEFIRLYHVQSNVFEFTTNKITECLPISQILYFESENRQYRIQTHDTSYLVYGKLSDLMRHPLLSSFIRIHKSYLINPRHISGCTYEAVLMDNEVKLPISRAYQKEVRARLLLQEFR